MLKKSKVQTRDVPAACIVRSITLVAYNSYELYNTHTKTILNNFVVLRHWIIWALLFPSLFHLNFYKMLLGESSDNAHNKKIIFLWLLSLMFCLKYSHISMHTNNITISLKIP